MPTFLFALGLLGCTGPTDDSDTRPADDSGTRPTDDSGTRPTDDLGCDYTPNVEIEGQLNQADGAPVPKGTVTVKVGEDDAFDTVTKGEGSFDLRVGDEMHGNTTITLSATDGSCNTSEDTVVVAAPCSNHEVTLVLDDCTP